MNEAEVMRFMTQGALYFAAARFVSTLAQPARTVQEAGEDGIYLPHFELHLASGIKLRVDVTVIDGS